MRYPSFMCPACQEGCAMKRREIQFPIICTLIGGLWAICWAMIHRQSEYDRTSVKLDKSVPVLCVGLAAGLLIGCCLSELARRWHAMSQIVAPIITVVLAASIAGPFGWL